MRKKKRGAALVIVVLTMSILFILGTTMLSVANFSYKSRIRESNRIRNLYGADSGVNVVENIITLTCEKAIDYGRKDIKSSIEDISKSELEINNEFKSSFIKFLDKSVMIEEEPIPLIKYLITNLKYINEIKISGEKWSIDLSEAWNEATSSEITINSYEVNEEDNEIIIEVESSFKDQSSQLKNERIISTTFVLTAPDYGSSVNKIMIYPVYEGKVITADGNIDINGEVDIYGDIWNKGSFNLKENMNYIFDKYKGGITINDGNVNIDGNVYTASTFQVANKSTAYINGKIYSLNTYIGKRKAGDESRENKITINDILVVNNDLSINSSSSTIRLRENFYGINDKNYKNISNMEKALNSSSIIVNSIDEDNLALIMEKDAYIMGVAYLDVESEVGERYQTGESIAVKGNYLAYTEVLEGYEDKVILEYYNPLHLIDSINDSDDYISKSEYFTEYYSYKYGNGNKLRSGGIEVSGNIYSTGAYINNGQAFHGNWTNETISEVNTIRESFATQVFSMGYISNGKSALNIYENQEVIKTVDTEIDFKQIKNIDESKLNMNDGLLIFNDDAHKEIIIENGYINGVAIEKAVIITNGDVIIKGQWDFTGNIITAGNVVIEEKGKVSLSYDPKVTRKIISNNYKEIKDIFKGEAISHEVNVESSNSYDADSYLKTTNWKIVK